MAGKLLVVGDDRPFRRSLTRLLAAEEYHAEFLARVRAHLRLGQEYQRPPADDGRIRVGPLVVDPDARDAHRDGRPVGLTQKEFELLHLLARHRNKALASEWIFEQVS